MWDFLLVSILKQPPPPQKKDNLTWTLIPLIPTRDKTNMRPTMFDGRVMGHACKSFLLVAV